MSDEKRPSWTHKEMSEGAFARLHEFGMVVSVHAKWGYLTADTTEEWLEVVNSRGIKMRLPSNWYSVCNFTGSAHSPGMFEWNCVGERMSKTLKEIRDFEKKNAADMAEYKRLKEKFGADE